MKRLSLILLLAAVLASDAGNARPQAAQQAAAAAPRAQARAFTPAKTPWGDPDLQGNYTNKYEYGTPFERPQEFEGRRLEDVTRQELADAREEASGEHTREREVLRRRSGRAGSETPPSSATSTK